MQAGAVRSGLCFSGAVQGNGILLRNLATALAIIAAVACLATPSAAAVRSVDVGLADNAAPAIDEGQVVWQGWDGSNWQIYLFDGSQVFQLSHGAANNKKPLIRKGRVVWQAFDGRFWQIFYFDGYQVYQLTNSGLGNQQAPRLDDDGNVVWEGWDGRHWQVYLYNGGHTTRLSDGLSDCFGPVVSQGQVAWLSPDIKGINQLYLWDGSQLRRITKKDISIGSRTCDLTKGALSPDIHNGQVVWQGKDLNGYDLWSIYLFKASDGTVRCLSDPKGYDPLYKLTYPRFDDRRPCLWEGKVVFESNKYAATYGWDIYFNNGRSNTRWALPGKDIGPVIRNGRTCWQNKTDGIWRVWRRDGEGDYGGTPAILSSGRHPATNPQIDSWGRVAWVEPEKGRNVIKLFDGNMPLSLGGLPLGDKTSPRVHEGKVVWQATWKLGDKAYQHVYLWDGTQAVAVTSDSSANTSPDIWEGTVCFLKENGGTDQVFVWRNGQAVPVTDSYPVKQSPRISGNQIVWRQDVAGDKGIYACPTPTIVHLTDGTADHQGLQFEHGLAAWAAGTGSGREIELWDGLGVMPVTANGYEDRNPHLKRGRLVWEGRQNGYWQVFLYTGSGVVQITKESYDNINPRLDEEGRIVWQGQVNGHWQIFLYDGGITRQLTPSTTLENTNPAVSWGEVAWRGQYSHMGSTHYQVWRWKGGVTTRLNLTAYDSSKPLIDTGKIAWTCSNGRAEQVFAWDGTQIEHVSDAYNDCLGVQLAGKLVVWQQYDGSDYEIYSHTIGQNGVARVTNNSVNDSSPVTDGSHIGWCSQEAGEWKVYLSDGSSTVKVTDGPGNQFSPQLSDGHLVWLESVGAAWQVRGWFPQVRRFSDEAQDSEAPVVSSDGHAAWQTIEGLIHRIYLWDGVAAQALSPAGYDAQNVAIDGMEAAWEQWDGAHRQIMYSDGYSTRALTSDPYDHHNPQLHQGRVVWEGSDGHDLEIFLFDGVATYRLTDNDYDDQHPQINFGQVAWESFDGKDSEIMFWDGATTYMVTVNDYSDFNPRLWRGQVVWQGWTGTNFDVYSWKWQGRPLFEPIGNQSVELGQLLQFQVKAIDPNDDTLTYSHSPLPAGASFDELTHVFSWTPGYSQGGTYEVYFTVSDGGNPPQSTTERVRISVGYHNAPPVLDPIGNKVIKAGLPLSIILTASDPNGESLSFSADGVPTGASFDPLTATFSWVPDPSQVGDHTVTFTVTDSGTPPLSDSEPVTITVGNNTAPVLDPIGNKVVPEGGLLTFTVAASDAENDTLSFSASNLPAGADFNAATRVFTWTPGSNQAGVYPGVRFSVVDDGVPSGEAHEDITITVVNSNMPPVIEPVGDKTVSTGQLLEFEVRAWDPDADRISLSATGLPTDVQWYARPHDTSPPTQANPLIYVFHWYPSYLQAGSWPITFLATENQTNRVTNSEFAPLMDDQGQIIGLPYPWVFEGTAPTTPSSGAYGGTYYLQWTDAAPGTCVHQTLANPPGMGSQLTLTYAFKGAAGTSSLAGIWNATDAAWVGGSSVVSGTGAWQLVQHTVTVGEQDQGDALEARFYATGTVAYDEVQCRLPQLSSSQPITIQVNYVNGAPILSPIGNKEVNWGATLSFKVHAYDPEGELMNFECTPLPSGATLTPDPASPATDYIFAWTPTQAQVGSYPLTFRVTDSGTPQLSDSEAVTIAVGDNHPPVINPIGDKSVDAGQTLQFTVSGSDPDGQGLTWSCYLWVLNPVTGRYQKQDLPAGAEFNAVSRTFTWQPGYAQSGTYTGVTFEAQDNGVPKMSATQAITITVNYVNAEPQFIQVGNTWHVLQSAFSAGVGDLLRFPVEAIDPNGEQVTYEAFNLPAHATFDAATRTFSWVPEPDQEGEYPNVTFRATDSGTPARSTIFPVTITVKPYYNRPPLFTQVGNTPNVVQAAMNAPAGQELRFPVKAADSQAYNIDPWRPNTITYSMEGPVTATFTQGGDGLWYCAWTPTTDQIGKSKTFTFQATDNGSPVQAGTARVTVTVTQP